MRPAFGKGLNSRWWCSTGQWTDGSNISCVDRTDPVGLGMYRTWLERSHFPGTVALWIISATKRALQQKMSAAAENAMQRCKLTLLSTSLSIYIYVCMYIYRRLYLYVKFALKWPVQYLSFTCNEYVPVISIWIMNMIIMNVPWACTYDYSLLDYWFMRMHSVLHINKSLREGKEARVIH